jgi:hypothetical protein
MNLQCSGPEHHPLPPVSRSSVSHREGSAVSHRDRTPSFHPRAHRDDPSDARSYISIESSSPAVTRRSGSIVSHRDHGPNNFHPRAYCDDTPDTRSHISIESNSPEPVNATIRRLEQELNHINNKCARAEGRLEEVTYAFDYLGYVYIIN